MPDATYVGAGMPCGNCGNPLTAGQPHKCGRTPDFDRRLDESWEPSPAASPDERLREAVRDFLDFIPGSPGWLAYERGRAAADSWWRSRLESDETVEAVARVIAGPAQCCCLSDWRQPRSRVCPVHGEGSWPYQSHYAKARAVLAALLPAAEKPETDT